MLINYYIFVDRIVINVLIVLVWILSGALVEGLKTMRLQTHTLLLTVDWSFYFFIFFFFFFFFFGGGGVVLFWFVFLLIFAVVVVFESRLEYQHGTNIEVKPMFQTTCLLKK